MCQPRKTDTHCSLQRTSSSGRDCQAGILWGSDVTQYELSYSPTPSDTQYTSRVRLPGSPMHDTQILQ